MRTIFILILFGISGTIAADPCDSEATQAEITRCYGDRAKAAASELDQMVAAYRARLSADQLSLFDQSQADWMQYRQSNCRFSTSGAEGGSSYSTIMSMCFEDVTRDRMAELLYFLTCAEGDMSCPVPE